VRAAAVPALIDGVGELEEDLGIRELSVVLSMAEYLAGRGHVDEDCDRAVRLGERALELTDRVRARWRVIARSRAPLAVVFQRLYGDIALLAQRLPGQGAAQLGLRTALSAKQTGFAARIRDGQTFDGNPHIDRLLTEIIEIETDSADTLANNAAKRRERLEKLRFQLAEAVSPMLADTVFPLPKQPTELVRAIGRRHVLDFVELRDTLENTPRLFRTLIEPGGRMAFELFDPGADFRAHFERAREPAAAAGALGDAADHKSDGTLSHTADRELDGALGDVADRRPDGGARDLDPAVPIARVDLALDFRALARAVLPERLTDEILAAAGLPVTLLISAHSWLSLLPWAALKIDDAGTRLVERAVIAQCPVLTCLADAPPPPVDARALIRLVGMDEQGVDVGLERAAWGLSPLPARDERLNECGLNPDARPKPYRGRFDAALARPGVWQFLHIAAHGGGRDFDQFLVIGNERLSAAAALALKWPASVLMASCHVGLVVNDSGAEPLNFVMALLTGGARCVVAGIGRIDDEGTGKAASRMVNAVRAEGVSLDAALRSAQLAAIGENMAEEGWALLSAYVR
jgi:hypothetical protein